MRVLQLGKYYHPAQGGIETVTRALAEGLAAAGVDSRVLCFAPKGRDAVETIGGCRIHRAATPLVLNSTPLSWSAVGLLARLARDADILHVHCPNPMAALAVWLTRPKAKLVLHWHSDVVRQKVLGLAYRPLERWLIHRADAVVGATPAHVEQSVHAGLFAGKAHVIPYCLDETFADPARLDRAFLAGLHGRFPGKKAVFALGRLVPYKGFAHLIDAAGLLPEDWVVLIGGSGPLRADLDARIRARGLAGRAVLLGRVPDESVSACYAFCRVFCLSSVERAEMFGVVQAEAMAWGKPVVSTAIPGSGVVHVNAHGETGLIVPPADASALARAVLDIDADEERYGRFAEACRARARRYAPGAVVEQFLSLYRGLLQPG